MKRFLLLIILVCCFVGCSDDCNCNSTDLDPQKLLGTWVFNCDNGDMVETNLMFACEFTDEGQNFSGRVYLSDGSSDWYYKSLSSYYVEGDMLYVVGDADDIKLQVTITDGDPDKISWTEIYNVEYGEDLNQNRTFSGYRSMVDYSGDIAYGVWEGRATDGREVNPYLRIKYNDDSTYEFQSRDSVEDEWCDNVGNDGHYYLLGDLLALTWFNDIVSQIEEYTNEAWVVSIDGDTMVLSATREDGVDEQFEFSRVVE